MSKKEVCIWGAHVVTNALEHVPTSIIRVCLDEATSRRLEPLKEALRDHDIPIETYPKKRLDQLTGEANHQGIVAFVNPAKNLTESELLDVLETKENPIIVLLDEIQDPHNVGAVMRSACAFGADAVVAPVKNAAPLTPAARKVACGGDLFVPYVQVTNLSRFIQSIQKMGFWVVGTMLDESAQPIGAIDLKGPIAIVLGSEGRGLRHKTHERCDFTAYIPIHDVMESLNVSVACGICLYEAKRQRAS